MNAASIGSGALWGAIAVGLVTLVPGLEVGRARRLLGLSAGLAGLATVTLAIALLAGDFSLAYVVDTTSRATPWPYRLSALWGGMDGSMLFYSTLTLVVGWIGARRARLGRFGIGIIAAIGVGYLLVTALVANPFDVLDLPAVDGVGLLAILQHPAMIYHPPILYLGMTVLVVPAAITAERVVGRHVDRAWLKQARRWLLVSWTLLTLGMVAGANWAYVELGWGGFWAWDPVENTSLMPWLAITVFLHTSRIQVQRGRLRRWNVLFALLPFALTVLGVYLTRSGVTGSIHAFAENPVIGRILLSAAAVVAIGSVFLALRAPRGEPWQEVGSGRDTWLAGSGILVTLVLFFVTIGSAYPAYARVFLGDAISIDSGFFTTTTFPFAVLIAAFVPFAFRTRWKRAALSWRFVGLYLMAVAVIALMATLIAFSPGGASVSLLALALASAGLLAWDIVRRRPRMRRLAGHLAHLGMAMILTGAAGSAMGDEYTGVMSPGDTISVGGHDISMLDMTTGVTDRFIFAEAMVEVDGERVLTPQIRAYEDQALPVAEPALLSGPRGDVIVAISLLFPDATAADVSVFVRPMVWWVWAGALVVFLGGVILIVSTAGDVSGRRRAATTAQQQAGTTSGTSAR